MIWLTADEKNVHGTLPSEIGRWSDVRWFTASKNSLTGTLANRAGTPVQRGLFKPRTKRVLWHHPNRVRSPSDIELGHAAWFQSFHRRAFAKHGRSLAQRQSLSRDRPLGDWAHDQLEKPSKQPLPQRNASNVSADFQLWFAL